MKIIYTILFFIVYHYCLNFLFKQVSDSKLILFIKRVSIFFILGFGIIIPLSILFLTFNFDDYKYSGFAIAISFIYTKFFFNYKILKNEPKN